MGKELLAMNDELIRVLLNVSVCFCGAFLFFNLVGPFLYSLIRGLVKKVFGKTWEWRWFTVRSPKAWLLWSSLFLLGAAGCLRYAVGHFAAFQDGSAVEGYKTYWEQVFSAFLHTLQTFSLDEGYDSFITVGKEMVRAVLPNAENAQVWYSLYASVLNVILPVLGGAVVIDLISEFFPMVRLHFVKLIPGLKLHIFSELNDKSLALAKSLMDPKKREWGTRIIFTDAYADDEEERGSERFSEARALGAICVKRDLLHVGFRWYVFKKVRFYLIDESENSNLQTLTSLLDLKKYGAIKRGRIVIFSSDSKYSNLEEEVSFVVNQWRAELVDRERASDARIKADPVAETIKKESRVRKRIQKEYDNFPTIDPVNGVRHMASSLLMRVPLFEPIIDRYSADGKVAEEEKDKKEKELTVTILGSGVIGTELFLTIYWCGQMLDCKLNVNVISKEQRRDFEGRINYINPEILQTKNPYCDLLKCRDDDTDTIPYFHYSYYESDVRSDNFLDLLKTDQNKLLKSDYFIVALGSDEENFDVADRLRRVVGIYHMNLDHPSKSKTVISYVVYNTDLCRALNKNCLHRYVKAEPGSNKSNPGVPDIYMFAFGDLEDVYGADNVFFNGIRKSALSGGMLYWTGKKEETTDAKKKYFQDLYSTQSDLAKSVHRKYKEFSAGFRTVSLFRDDVDYEEASRKAELDYIKHFAAVGGANFSAGNRQLHEMAWLEHRRWCAYLRSRGFRKVDFDLSKYQSLDCEPEHTANGYKFISLRIHPCLTECSKEGLDATFDQYGVIVPGSEFYKSINKTRAIRDKLDEVDIRVNQPLYCEYLQKKSAAAQMGRPFSEKVPKGFKYWDYPECDLNGEDIKALLYWEPDLDEDTRKRLIKRYNLDEKEAKKAIAKGAKRRKKENRA